MQISSMECILYPKVIPLWITVLNFTNNYQKDLKSSNSVFLDFF